MNQLTIRAVWLQSIRGWDGCAHCRWQLDQPTKKSWIKQILYFSRIIELHASAFKIVLMLRLLQIKTVQNWFQCKFWLSSSMLTKLKMVDGQIGMPEFWYQPCNWPLWEVQTRQCTNMSGLISYHHNSWKWLFSPPFLLFPSTALANSYDTLTSLNLYCPSSKIQPRSIWLNWQMKLDMGRSLPVVTAAAVLNPYSDISRSAEEAKRGTCAAAAE